jgi:hypothetical protein
MMQLVPIESISPRGGENLRRVDPARVKALLKAKPDIEACKARQAQRLKKKKVQEARERRRLAKDGQPQ